MNEPRSKNKTPSEQALSRVRKYVEKYRDKSGTSGHPNPKSQRPSC